MDVSEAIRTKRAIRQFTDQPLPEDSIRAILNAGRHSQSSKNTQPWQFIAVRDRDMLKRLSECGDFAGHLAGAALGIALAAPVDDPERYPWIMYDLGQAASYMQLAAWELGIGSCIATIYEPEKAAAILRIPAGYRCDVALSFGYPAADVSQLPPRKGGRRPLDEIVHWEQW